MIKSNIVTCSVHQFLQQLGQPPAKENHFEWSAYCLRLLTFASLSSRSLDFFIRSSQKKRFIGNCPLEMTRKMGRDNLPLWKWKWEKNTYTSWSCPSVWPNSTIWSSYVGSHGKRRTGSFDKNLSDVKYLIAFTTIEDIASRGEKHIYQDNLKRPQESDLNPTWPPVLATQPPSLDWSRPSIVHLKYAIVCLFWPVVIIASFYNLIKIMKVVQDPITTKSKRPHCERSTSKKRICCKV